MENNKQTEEQPLGSELFYGNKVQWLLSALAAYGANEIDGDEFDVYREGRSGIDGCETISITTLAHDAAMLLAAKDSEYLRLRETLEPVYQCRFRNGYNGHATVWQTIRRDQVDYVLKEFPHAEFQIISAPQLLAESERAELKRLCAATVDEPRVYKKLA